MVSGFLSCFELKLSLAELRSATGCLETVLAVTLLDNFNIVYPDRIYNHFSVVPDSFLAIDFCSRWRKNFTAPSRRKASATSRPADRMAESSALCAPKKEKQAVSACFLFQICSSVLRGEPLSRNISSEALRSLFHAVLHPCTSRERCRGSRQGSASWQA